MLIVLELYCRIPFGQMHSRNPEAIRVAVLIGRTPGAVAMKLVNIASLDPGLKQRGISGLSNASASDRAIWQEMNADWQSLLRRHSLRSKSLSYWTRPRSPKALKAKANQTERQNVKE